MKDDRLYLIHIGECIERIQKYTKAGKDDFMLDQKTQDAVMRNLETLARSIKRASESFKFSHLEIEWKGIAGHDNLEFDLIQVWDIVENDIPTLKRKIIPLLDWSQAQ